MKHRTCALVIAVVTLLSAFTANAQSSDMVADLAARINRERTSRGLVPFALNSDLSLAAQAHASDMARTGNLSHTGSDGSTVFQRVARTGYGSYSWGRRLGENWAWYRSTADAMSKWMGSRPHRENILHTLYREFGIGIAVNPVGGYIFVVNFGAQPNVLPIFINDGAGSTPASGVTLVLSDEEVAPSGDTPTTMGHPTEIQISNDADFSAKWEPYSARRSWTLASGSGARTVYVKFRDARGRMVTSSDSITVGGAAAANLTGALATVKPTASRTQTRRPTATRTRTPRPTATRTRTPSPTASASPSVSRTAAPTQTEALPLPLETPTEMLAAVEQTPEPAILSTSPLPVEPTKLAAVPATSPEDLEQPTVQQSGYSDTPSLERTIESVLGVAQSSMSDTGRVSLAGFAAAAVIGIMALAGHRSGRVSTAAMGMRTKRMKKNQK